MNRNDEFTEFMKELDGSVPEVGESIQRGSRRKARKQFLYQPLMCLAAMFMLFVLSVNLCAPVAKAFSNIPLLKDLTKAVAFSKSLKDAIENDYMKEVDLKQTKDGVTVEIVSMVVDNDTLSVFYRVASDKYEDLAENSTVYDESGKNELGWLSYEKSGSPIPNDEIRCVTVNTLRLNTTESIFMGTMPEKVRLQMVVWDGGAYTKDFFAGAQAGNHYVLDREKEAEKYYITSFDFLLELDPDSIPEPLRYEVNQTLEIEGRKFRVEEVQVYPTHMQISGVDFAENTATLRDLHFYVETEDGERFYHSKGMAHTIPENPEEPVRFWFDMESPYFSDSESLTMVIFGAEWREPEKKCTSVNLTTGEVTNLPEYVMLEEIKEVNGTIYLKFSQECVAMADERTGERIDTRLSSDPFYGVYYDGEGKEHEAVYRGFSPKEELGWSVTYYGDMERDENDDLTGRYNYTLCLTDYPYEEISLENWYSDAWRGEEEVSVVIK